MSMTENVPMIFPPSSLEEILVLVSKMPEPQFDILKKDVKDNGFDSDLERCKYLGNQIGLSAEALALVLSALAFLYSRTRKYASSADLRSAFSELIEMTEEGDADDEERQGLIQRLVALLSPSYEIDLARKIRRLRTGFLKNATGFASFVDVRPDFDLDNSKIRSLVVMVQFRVATDAEDRTDREFVFQIDESGLDALKKAVETAEQKIKTIKSENKFGAPFNRRNWVKDD